MTNTGLLKAYIDKSGYKRTYIAESLGLSSYGLAKKINNRSEFKTSEIIKLCSLLQINTLEDRERVFFNVK